MRFAPAGGGRLGKMEGSLALFLRWILIGLVVGIAAGALYGLDYALVGAGLGIIAGVSAAAILRVRQD